jgi:hypothetical protein
VASASKSIPFVVSTQVVAAANQIRHLRLESPPLVIWRRKAEWARMVHA